MRILMIEDDKDLCESVAFQLKSEGYYIDICLNGDEGLLFALSQSHDIIILDRMLPSLNGISILESIRSKGIVTPVIMVTAMNSIGDRIGGLDSGADDYLVKPFDISELKARIRALARRPRLIENLDIIKFSNLSLNIDKRILESPFEKCSLSRRESDLLEYFMHNKNRILTREQILSHVWGVNCFVEDGNIDNYIHFLRRRLKAVKSNAVIKTIHSVGYILEEKE